MVRVAVRRRPDRIAATDPRNAVQAYQRNSQNPTSLASGGSTMHTCVMTFAFSATIVALSIRTLAGMSMHPRHLNYVTALALSCVACSPGTRAIFYELHYGTSPVIFMQEEPAADYIPDDVDAVPKALTKCGAHFIAFNGRVTDGGEIAYFSTFSDDNKTKTCVKMALPQAGIVPADPRLVEKLRLREKRGRPLTDTEISER